ncbi:MAG: formate dehydrogenase accessory sulfurtransferase FdhD [Alphaproteobacteria bacterium]|nr:formate dehydrogenase accessory sulfurtransferase FdhD [Alphaproteobacteria bacterium]
MTLRPSIAQDNVQWRGDSNAPGTRVVAAEVPVAFVYDGGTEAVMMATPGDLHDFALGFSLNDGIVTSLEEIGELAIVEVERGIELRMTLKLSNRDALVARRRHRAGPVGCGLCGVESIDAAVPALPRVVADIVVAPSDIVAAMQAMAPLQALNRETRAVHAAALFVPGEGVVALREDVGRHNALDKLCGALVRAGRKASDGVILMTSRISVELVQKAAHMGAGVLAAISAPTALALLEAEAAGVTLVGVVRDDGLEVFTHGERVHAR